MKQSSPRRPLPREAPGRVNPGHPCRPPTVLFAEAAKVLAATARSHGLRAPSYRTPPRLVGVDRTVRRNSGGGAVAVRVKGRPWPAVVADMIDGVIALNRLSSARANRVRADLWNAVFDHFAHGALTGPIVSQGGGSQDRVA